MRDEISINDISIIELKLAIVSANLVLFYLLFTCTSDRQFLFYFIFGKMWIKNTVGVF